MHVRFAARSLPSSDLFIHLSLLSSTTYKLSSAMKNLFCWIFGLGLALAAANYFISEFAALIDLIPTLFTLRRSYICIFSLLLGCAYKLSSVMMTLLGYAAPLSSNLAELFISEIVDAIFSRIMTPITSYASTVIGCLKVCTNFLSEG